MATKSSTTATPHNSTRGEAAILDFANSNLTLEQTRQRAAVLLNSKQLLQNVLGLTPEDQTKFVDKVNQAYPTVDPHNAKFVTTLGKICSGIERLPTSAVLSAGLKKHHTISIASGGFTDVWQGGYHSAPVAIKSFRIYPAENLKEAKEILWKRVPMWKRLSHENILSFFGVNMTHFQLALVYDWGQHSNINKYIELHPHACRTSLLFDVTKGLEYLHSLDIPHGALKGANVVIDRRGRARLTEYGLAPIISGPSFTTIATPDGVRNSRWLAPEIIDPFRKGNSILVMESKAADVFAFGMLAVEVFTGHIPFEEQRNQAVVLHIWEGGRPELPGDARAVGLTCETWKFLESCWQRNPRKRPTVGEVVGRWEKFVGKINDVIPEEPQHAVGPTPGNCRPRAKTEVPQPPKRSEPSRPRTKPKPPRPRTRSEAIQTRGRPEPIRPRIRSEAVRSRTKLEDVQQAPISELVRLRTKSLGPPSELVFPSRRRICFCGMF